jgi:hypothetical protein
MLVACEKIEPYLDAMSDSALFAILAGMPPEVLQRFTGESAAPLDGLGADGSIARSAGVFPNPAAAGGSRMLTP